MTADQLAVLGEGHVAFDDAGAHARGRHIGFPAVLGKLHRRAAVADGKVGLAKRPGALGKLRLQRPVLHLVDEIERPRPDLRLARQRDVIRRGGKDDDERQQRGQQGGAMAGGHGWHLE